MASVTMRWRRKEELYRKLKRLAPEAEKEMTVANGEAANEMAELARSFVPVGRTGKLKESIVVTPPGGTPPEYSQGANETVPRNAYMVTVGNTKVRYGHHVEFGTPPHIAGGMFEGAQHPGVSARPFFFPAYRLVKRKHKNRSAKAIRKSINTVAKR